MNRPISSIAIPLIALVLTSGCSASRRIVQTEDFVGWYEGSISREDVGLPSGEEPRDSQLWVTLHLRDDSWAGPFKLDRHLRKLDHQSIKIGRGLFPRTYEIDGVERFELCWGGGCNSARVALSAAVICIALPVSILGRFGGLGGL